MAFLEDATANRKNVIGNHNKTQRQTEKRRNGITTISTTDEQALTIAIRGCTEGKIHKEP